MIEFRVCGMHESDQVINSVASFSSASKIDEFRKGQQHDRIPNAIKKNQLHYQEQTGGEPNPYIEHRINTGDSPPVSVPPYRLSPVKKELLKKELDKLLEENIIEECKSPYAAPVVHVPKSNGNIRLCTDYRGLNAITIADSFPLPRMDALFMLRNIHFS
ncbi:hypothetical protein AVEN_130077-1 [Araneus ventricosus]|uniref:Transposon Ty3-I Gag-Pol polyprotein n=1 Tax=Araneus ventricosus TaxID=182803 RepID=A0A4Y2ENX0_ARAVE|nr:hypothetical protein AVEN_130077-1 [Araneus ventricosus]